MASIAFSTVGIPTTNDAVIEGFVEKLGRAVLRTKNMGDKPIVMEVRESATRSNDDADWEVIATSPTIVPGGDNILPFITHLPWIRVYGAGNSQAHIEVDFQGLQFWGNLSFLVPKGKHRFS